MFESQIVRKQNRGKHNSYIRKTTKEQNHFSAKEKTNDNATHIETNYKIKTAIFLTW